MGVLFQCNAANAIGEAFPHFWETCIGSGHATLALRADWQQQIQKCREELGFTHVRFHGILSHGMGTLVDENNELVYSLFNADQVFDFLDSIGMAPFVELSFMPLALSSGDTTVFNYKDNVTPPRQYEDWEKLIKTVVAHWVDRYGIEKVKNWFFEIWNEPNLEAFWTSSQEEYFTLYRHATRAVKSIDPRLMVGGPATASNAWVADFVNYCVKENVPYDFISTHHYPTDAFGKPGDDTVSQLAASHRGVLREQVIETRAKAGNTPVYYTEWCTSSNPFDELHDDSYAAAFITKTVIEAEGFVQGYSYWTFSDIFDENYFSSIPFHGGFGLLNIYGIPKPAYRAYEILHRLGTTKLPVTGTHETIDVWVFQKQKEIQLLICNSALPKHPVKTETVELELAGLMSPEKAFVVRIDDDHANAKKGWLEMGRPGSLKKEEVKMLEASSALVKEALSFQVNNGKTSLTLDLPPQGIALITLS